MSSNDGGSPDVCFQAFALLLKSVEQSQSGFEGMSPDAGVIVVIGISAIVSPLPLDAEVVSQLEYKARVEDQQLRVAFVALRVEVERIGVLQVFTLISFPCMSPL